MRFRMDEKPITLRKDDTIWTYDHWRIFLVTEGLFKKDIVIATVVGGDRSDELSKDLAPLLAGDYCDFLNEKYIDKEFNKEWREVDVDARVKYHEEQIEMLKRGNYTWNRHGTGVEEKWK